ncbi:MAG: hypothetical protein AB8B99_11625 [Phormidesmis sp.]
MTNFNFTKKGIALSVGITTAALVSVAPAAEAASFNLNFDEGADGGSVLYNADGTLQLDQWEDWGVTLSGTANRNANDENDWKRDGRIAKLNTYNTDTWGRDNDLRTGSNYGTAAQGNVLIIQEEKSENRSNGQWVADDEGWGGKVNFDFANAISLTSFSMLDIDDNGHGIRVTGTSVDGGEDLNIDIDKLINDHYAANGNSQGSIFTNDKGVTITQVGSKRNDNSMYRFDLDQDFFAGRRFSNVEFKYPGSGAISGIEWNTDNGTPEEIPEPSVIGGLLMIGFVGARKYRKNKLSA